MQTVTHSDALSRFGCALSDPTRAEILLMLREAPGYPSELTERIGVSRQILSDQLACPRGCGLVVAEPEGRRSRYRLADERIGHALGDLLGLVLTVDPACCPAAEEPLLMSATVRTRRKVLARRIRMLVAATITSTSSRPWWRWPRALACRRRP